VWPRSDTHSFLSDLILCVRFRSDGWGLREEEAHRGVRVSSSPVRCGTGMDDGDVADVPGTDEEVDEMHSDAEVSNVRSACSCSSWNDDEVRLERRCSAGRSGRGAVRRL
jgi:hypothetical protein